LGKEMPLDPKTIGMTQKYLLKKKKKKVKLIKKTTTKKNNHNNHSNNNFNKLRHLTPKANVDSREDRSVIRPSNWFSE